MDSISGQVLESQKIGSENAKEVRGVLKDVRRDWGRPLAIVHDLRQSLITAAGEVFKGVPQFVCHYHFAADIGKDILEPDVDRLRRLVRRTKVRPKLGALVRSLKDSAVDKESGEPTVTPVLGLRSTVKLREMCSPELAKARSSMSHPTLLQALVLDAVALDADIQIKMAQLLVDQGSPLDEPLISTGSLDNAVMAKFIMEQGGAIDGRQDIMLGWTAIEEALYWQNTKTVQQLVALGAAIKNLRIASGVGDIVKTRSYFKSDGSLNSAIAGSTNFPF